MNADQFIRKAISLSKKGETEKAFAFFRKVLIKFPSNKRAQDGISKLFVNEDHNRVSHPSKTAIDEIINCQKSCEYMLAIKKSEQVLERFPFSFVVWNLLGVSYKKIGEKRKSLDAYHNALLIYPDYADAYFNLGNSLILQGLFEEAENAFEKAAKIQPKNAKIFFNLAYVHNEKSNLEKAEKNLKTALELSENYAEALHLLAQIYYKKGHADLALSKFKASIASKPDYPETYNNMSNVLWDLGRSEEAIEALETAVALKPSLFGAASKKAYFIASKNSYGNQKYLKSLEKLNEDIKNQKKKQFKNWQKKSREGSLRVGFVSADFRDHPVGYFLENFLQEINSEKLEFVAFSNSEEETELTIRIKPFFQKWHSIFGMRDEDAAQLIHNTAPDILIDLSGHTGGNRLPLFFIKPAPIQATWLGYFASTGIETIDFIIGDRFVTPYNSQDEFTEKIIQMPKAYCCFSAPDFEVKVTETPALNKNNITFGCFNRADKLSSDLIVVWSRILNEVGNASMYFRGAGYDKNIIEMIINEFRKNGVNKDCLVFAEKTNRKEFLASYNEVDICLDTFPYPGGTSTCEALWMGVPIITKKGTNFLSRVGETIANNSGNESLCAKNEEEYISLAVQLTKDIPTLNKSRIERRERTLNSPLFDAKLFASDFEKLLFKMHQTTKEMD